MNARIINIMKKLESEDQCSLSTLAKDFSVTERTIRSDLKKINDFLNQYNLSNVELDRAGIIEVNNDFLQYKKHLDPQDYYHYRLSKNERVLIASIFLLNCIDYTTISHIADHLLVSRATIINDLPDIKKFCDSFDLKVESHPNKGLRIKGNEKDIRKCLVDLFTINSSQMSAYFYTGLNKKSTFNHEFSNIIIDILNEVQQEHHIAFREDSLNTLHYYLNIMVERNLNNKYITENIESNKQDSTYLYAYTIIRYVSKYCGVLVKENEILFLSNEIKENIEYISTAKDTQQAIAIQVKTKQLIQNVSEEINIDLTRDYQFYEQLSNHLIAIFNSSFEEDFNNPLLQDINKNEQEIIQIIRQNLGGIESYFGRALNTTEILYIAIHFLTAIQRYKSLSKDIDVILVCNVGIGTSQFLKTKLNSIFNINVIQTLPSYEVDKISSNRANLIISTVPIYNSPIETIQVSTNLSANDYALIGDTLNKLQSEKMQVNFNKHDSDFNIMKIMRTIDPILKEETPLLADSLSYKIGHSLLQSFNENTVPEKREAPYLFELLSPDFIQLDIECDNWKNAIRASAAPLLLSNYISNEYIESIISATEKLGPYYIISPGVAIPHASIEDGSFKTGMSLIRLKNPVSFDVQTENLTEEQKVPISYVITMSTRNEKEHLKAFFHLLNLLHNTDFKDKMDVANSPENLNNLIQIYEFEINDY